MLTEDVARPEDLARDARPGHLDVLGHNNEQVVVNPRGQVIAKTGTFEGVNDQGRRAVAA